MSIRDKIGGCHGSLLLGCSLCKRGHLRLRRGERKQWRGQERREGKRRMGADSSVNKSHTSQNLLHCQALYLQPLLGHRLHQPGAIQVGLGGQRTKVICQYIPNNCETNVWLCYDTSPSPPQSSALRPTLQLLSWLSGQAPRIEKQRCPRQRPEQSGE